MAGFVESRQLHVIVDYLFGIGTSRVLPESGFKFIHSRRSGRIKMILHEGNLFATVKPNGAMALSVYGARILLRGHKFRENCVQVPDEVLPFVRGGKSVFCKFVKWAGRNVQPKSEVVVVDERWNAVGVGTAVLNGKVMRQFSSGVAVKVRKGLRDNQMPASRVKR